MRRFCRLIALVLLAMWLPATMHCGLEALSSEMQVGGNICDDKQACDHDGCDLLEKGGYSSAIQVVKVMPVLLADFAPWRDVLASLESSLLPVVEAEKPPVEFEMRVLPDWQFARRAASLPGAPQFRLS